MYLAIISSLSAFLGFISYGLSNNIDYISSIEAARANHIRGGRFGSLSQSSWPADHGDNSRSKYSLDAGLPANFNPDDIKIHTQKELESPQWLYTQGSRSEFIYLIGGNKITASYIAKVNAITLDVIQKFQLPPSLYLGGLLMHSNGHVYAIHANTLYAFWNGDLSNVTSIYIPSRLNIGIIQTNGMLVTQDGYLVVKQWSTMLDDILFYAIALPPVVR